MTSELGALDPDVDGPRHLFDVVETTITAVSQLMHIDSEAMRLAFTLRTASATVFHDLHKRLESAGGASPRAMTILLLIATNGELEQGELTKQIGLSKASVSVLVEHLVQDGLVERGARAGDRRVVILTPTPAGTEKVIRDFTVFNQGESAWSESLTAHERETLIALLRKLVLNGPGEVSFQA